jgi:cytochrome c oxidase subunit II
LQVRRRRCSRGIRLALLAVPLTFVLSGCSAHDAERDLRFGWPTGVTKQAEEMRVLWTWSSVTALVVGVLVWGLIFYACIFHRKKSDDLPRQTKYNLPLEIAYSLIPFVIITGLFYRTVVVENSVDKLTKTPDVRIQVDAFKWNWLFEYHSVVNGSGTATATVYKGFKDVVGAEGSAADKRTGAGGQAGCDEASSNVSFSCGASGGQANSTHPLYLSTVGSDNEIPVLVLPVHRTVRVVEHSEDVVHSFWVPEFLFKRDVIPYGTSSTNRDNQFEFTPTSTGSFVGRCAEMCGMLHSEMNFEVRVVSEAQFQRYLAALAKYLPGTRSFPHRQSLALRAAGMSPYATTTHPFKTDPNDRSASESMDNLPGMDGSPMPGMDGMDGMDGMQTPGG